MIRRPVAVFIAMSSIALFPSVAAALSTDVGSISCDVIVDYGATSPAYFEVFQSYLEGYLAGQKSAAKLGRDDRDAAAVLSQIVEYCRGSRDSSFAAAVAAVAK